MKAEGEKVAVGDDETSAESPVEKRQDDSETAAAVSADEDVNTDKEEETAESSEEEETVATAEESKAAPVEETVVAEKEEEETVATAEDSESAAPESESGSDDENRTLEHSGEVVTGAAGEFDIPAENPAGAEEVETTEGYNEDIMIAFEESLVETEGDDIAYSSVIEYTGNSRLLLANDYLVLYAIANLLDTEPKTELIISVGYSQHEKGNIMKKRFNYLRDYFIFSWDIASDRIKFLADDRLDNRALLNIVTQ